MDRALYVGRFQPFHKGHKKVVERLDNRHDELVVAIGGPELSYSERHPFQIGERIQMIKESVSIDFDSTYLLPIPDIDNNSLWVGRIENYTPEFSVVYSNNELVKILFEDSGYNVKGIDWVDRNRLSGTEVRERMIGDNDWRCLVPSSVERIVDKNNGVDRINRVSNG